MKIQIDPNGDLLIERAGNLKPQFCQRITGEDGRYRCGDSCPLFGEPFWRNREHSGEKYDESIQLCYIKLNGHIEDKRIRHDTE